MISSLNKQYKSNYDLFSFTSINPGFFSELYDTNLQLQEVRFAISLEKKLESHVIKSELWFINVQLQFIKSEFLDINLN